MARRSSFCSDDTYYRVLQVSRDATQAEIHSAHHDLVMKYHPDKCDDGGAKFIAIREAFDVLRSTSRRNIYDRLGVAGARFTASQAQEQEEEEPVRGPTGFNLFNMFFSGRARAEQAKSPSVRIPFEISLERLYNGESRSLNMMRSYPCEICKGSGVRIPMPRSQIECLSCDGAGTQLMQRNVVVVPGAVNPPPAKCMRLPCPTCTGLGIIVKTDDRCISCAGRRMKREKIQVDIHVLPGMRDGDEIVIEGAGDLIPKHRAGDLIVVLRQVLHERFRRQRDDLAMRSDITLADALTGVAILFKHLDGRVLKVQADARHIFTHSDLLIVSGEGMPIKNSCGRKRGNLYIELHVIYPASDLELTDKQKKTLRRILKSTPLQYEYVPSEGDVVKVVNGAKADRIAAPGEDETWF